MQGFSQITIVKKTVLCLKYQEELCAQSHADASITCEGKLSCNLLSMQELHFWRIIKEKLF